jgi:RHS repeat-associated protein
LRCAIDALGNRTTHAYDKAGNEIGVMNANGYISTAVYDATDRRVATVSPLGYRTTSLFDAAGNRIALVDANGGRNSFTFDAADRKTFEIDPLGRRTTFSYDDANRQTAKLDARGVLVTYQYDAVNQPTGRVYTGEVPVTMQYDPVGNRTVLKDVTGISTTTYDPLNRVSAVVNPSGKSITYTFDATARRRTLMEPGGGLFTYSHDSAGRIAYLVNPQADRTTFSYDPANRRTLTQLANGTRASVTYDEASRLTQLYNLKSDDSVISGFTYDYDPFGNRTSVLEASGDRVTWTYDPANQLLNEQRSGANAYNAGNSYDPVGNRLVKNLDGALTTYAYDLANQLLTARDTSGTTTYTFDPAGNQRLVLAPNAALTTNTWNADNRLIGVALPSGALVTNTYHADGLRHERQDADGTIRFLWDHQNYLAETDETDEIQAVYTNEPLVYGNLISQYRKTGELWTPSYYHFDASRSTRELTDVSQGICCTLLYDSWGRIINSSGVVTNPFRFVGCLGYYFDESTDTYYIRQRILSSYIVRWLSRDPILASLFTTGYEYANNTPVSFSDPSGLQPNHSPPTVGDVVCIPQNLLWANRTTFSILLTGEECRACHPPGAPGKWAIRLKPPRLDTGLEELLRPRVGPRVDPRIGPRIPIDPPPPPPSSARRCVDLVPPIPICYSDFVDGRNKDNACRLCNGTSDARARNPTDLDEDFLPIETEGLTGIVSHYTCKSSDGSAHPYSLLCGKCCVDTVTGPVIEERCKCALTGGDD